MYHSYLDDIGSSALNRGIDGITLGKATHGSVLRVDIRQIATTTEEGSDVALFAGNLLRLFHVVVYLREGLEVTVNQHLSLFSRNIQTFSQTKDSDAIDDTEVGPF